MLTPDDVADLTTSVGPTLYHLTAAENVPAILAGGLLPDQDSQFEPDLTRPGVIYLCTRTVAQIAMSFDEAWGDAIFAAEIADLDPSLLSAGTLTCAGPIPSPCLRLAYVTLRTDLPAVMAQARTQGTTPIPWRPGRLTF